jgi:ATP-dependent Clp protease ATP-binding subunit ClpC
MIKRQTGLGFAIPQDEEADGRGDYEEMRDKLLDELKRTFRPEFLNRVDSVIVFHALSREEIAQIVDLELSKVQARLKETGIGLEVTDEAKTLLAEEGYSDEYGARPLRRVIQNRIEDVLSDAILADKFSAGDTVLAQADEGEIALCHTEEKAEEPAEEPVLA